MSAQYIHNVENLKKYLELTKEEEEYWNSAPPQSSLPLRVSPHWLKCILSHGGEVFRKQAVPQIKEKVFQDYELEDPIGDDKHSPLTGLIHHYTDRALILMTDQCAMYCRHCFRRHHTGRRGRLSHSQIDGIIDYLSSHDEIHEIILSGGDALMVPDEYLKCVLNRLSLIPRRLVVRLASRIPLVAPSLMTPSKIDIIASYPMLWLVTQINHPLELTVESEHLFRLLAKRGIPIINQSVLLKGINDSLEVQKELCYRLIETGIKPYYLFQCDLARGTSHFRVPLKKALRIYDGLKKSISHLALPRFALDLPGGGGKVNLDDLSLVDENDSSYRFNVIDGRVGFYPKEGN